MSKEEGATTVVATPTTKIENSAIKRQVRALFLAGEAVTAIELNNLIGFNDARKVISTLRAEGMPITDCYVGRSKLYWLNKDEGANNE